MRYSIGDLVKWDYSEEDSSSSAENYGTGIIVEIKYHDMYGLDQTLLYKIYRTKHKDCFWFEDKHLNLKGENK